MAVIFPVGTTIVELVVRVLATTVDDSLLIDGNDSVLPPVVGAALVWAAADEVGAGVGVGVAVVSAAEEEDDAAGIDAAAELEASLPGTVIVTPALLQRAPATASASL